MAVELTAACTSMSSFSKLESAFSRNRRVAISTNTCKTNSIVVQEYGQRSLPSLLQTRAMCPTFTSFPSNIGTPRYASGVSIKLGILGLLGNVSIIPNGTRQVVLCRMRPHGAQNPVYLTSSKTPVLDPLQLWYQASARIHDPSSSKLGIPVFDSITSSRLLMQVYCDPRRLLRPLTRLRQNSGPLSRDRRCDLNIVTWCSNSDSRGAQWRARYSECEDAVGRIGSVDIGVVITIEFRAYGSFGSIRSIFGSRGLLSLATFSEEDMTTDDRSTGLYR